MSFLPVVRRLPVAGAIAILVLFFTGFRVMAQADVDPAAITFHIGYAAAEFWMDCIRFYEGDYVAPVFRAETLATEPRPEHGATDVPRDVVLSWTAGEFAATHDVYFGTVFADVNDANFDSAVFLPEGAIRCTDLSTSIHGIGAVAQSFWLNDQDGTVLVRGLSAAGGPVLVEAFDAAGRLLQRSAATFGGGQWSASWGHAATGIVLLRAWQAQHLVTGKVFVR